MTEPASAPNLPSVVVVNDDPTQLRFLCALVRRAGFAPCPFPGARAALEAMTAGSVPALIVTDLSMPEIDGWRFCRLLHSPEYAALNRIPILVVSATFAGEESVRIASDLGAEGFLPSPVDGPRFIDLVQAIAKGERVRLPLHVLIVDDDALLADSLQRVFAANGHRVDTAGTVRQAAAVFAASAYDLAVIDYDLPDGTGDGLLERFRAARPDCVCLMMTTDPAPTLALDWMQRGAAAYLHKPFEPGYLLELSARARRERALLRVQDLLELRTRELRASEERYHRIADTVTDYIYTVTVEKGHARKTTHGPACVAVTGYTSEEFEAQPYLWYDMVFPDDRDRVVAFAARVLAGGSFAPVEHRVRRKDGRVRWVSNTPVPQFDSSGVLIAYDGLISDITARKEMEAALVAKVEELRQALEQIKTLRGIVPICSSCKKVRDDRGYWDQVETYISRHSEARFSHGMCPDCMKRMYPDFASPPGDEARGGAAP